MSEGELTLNSARPPASLGHVQRMLGFLHERDFRLFWTGETTSQVGTAVAEVVLPLIGVRVLHAGTFAIASLPPQHGCLGYCSA